jgi:hypothetical protein
MTRRAWLGSLGLLAVLPAVGIAGTLRVPSEYGTISTAIAAAVAGDTVQVAPVV